MCALVSGVQTCALPICSIYKTRPLGVVGGLLGEDALYDTGPLKRLLKRFANEAKLRASGRKLLLGVVNLGTGIYRTIDESVPGIHNWVYASCAMPLFFDPLKTRARDGTEVQWGDGGEIGRASCRERGCQYV